MNLNQIEFELMPHQTEFVFDTETPVIGFMGGMRMGKSVAAVHHAIVLSALHPGREGALLSPTYGMTKRNLLPIFRDLNEKYRLNITGLDNKNPDMLTINWGNKTSTIHLSATAENHDRMNGMSLAWAGLDEADKCLGESATLAVEQMRIRVSNPAPKKVGQIFITSTPEGKSFMSDYFIDQVSNSKKLYSASMLDNYLLTPEYIESQMENIPAHKRAAYIQGLPVSFNVDAVYKDFDDKLNHTDLTLADLQPHEKVWVCWDINDGGTSVLMMFHRDKKTYVVEEWMGMRNTKEVLEKVKKQPWAKQAILTCDPACTQVFGFIHESGLVHRIMNSAPLIEHSVNAVNLGFCNGRQERNLFVNTKKCKVLTKCLIGQGYVNGAPDKKTKVPEAKTDISGPLDALRYGYFITHPWYPLGATGSIKLRGF